MVAEILKVIGGAPDSLKIAYLQLDESPVKKFTVIDHIPYTLTLENTSYPKAGDPNPLVKVGIVNATGGDTQWVDMSAYQDAEILVSQVDWTPEGGQCRLFGPKSRANLVTH